MNDDVRDALNAAEDALLEAWAGEIEVLRAIDRRASQPRWWRRRGPSWWRQDRDVFRRLTRRQRRLWERHASVIAEIRGRLLEVQDRRRRLEEITR